jgi:hypothetical protein
MDLKELSAQISGGLGKLSQTASDVSVLASTASTLGSNLQGIEIKPVLNKPTVNVPITDTIKVIAPYLLLAFLVILGAVLLLKTKK